MTIEYTYQSRPPVGATIKGKNRAYSISSGEVLVWIGDDARSVEKADVPEVCEAMMRLAGHDVEHACVTDVGKRIIARLVMQAPTITTSYAANIVREECGL